MAKGETGLSEVEITPLLLARVKFPDFHPEAPGSCEILGYLIRDHEDFFLVDTGVGLGSDEVDGLYQPERVELSTAVSRAGVSFEQITAIVNSHLHFDHCGNNSLFPDVPIFVQDAELVAARQPGYTVPEWVDFAKARYTAIRGRHAISPHVELIPTPGHTPGHQSVVVRSPSGIDVIVAQASYTASEFDSSWSGTTEVPDGTWSQEAYVGSLNAIRLYGPNRAFFSHDSVVWERAA